MNVSSEKFDVPRWIEYSFVSDRVFVRKGFIVSTDKVIFRVPEIKKLDYSNSFLADDFTGYIILKNGETITGNRICFMTNTLIVFDGVWNRIHEFGSEVEEKLMKNGSIKQEKLDEVSRDRVQEKLSELNDSEWSGSYFR